jgi:hypothetical protein
MPSLKLDELQEIQYLYGYNIYECFIESGSYMGSTIDNIKNNFNEINTIELNENLHKFCKKKFKNVYNINCIQGNSIIELENILKKNNKNIIFFLDAHYSGGETSRSEEDVPLLEELKVINKYFKNNGIIIIDDLRLFNTNYNEDWSNITKKNILEKLDKLIIKFSLTMDKIDKFVIYL